MIEFLCGSANFFEWPKQYGVNADYFWLRIVQYSNLCPYCLGHEEVRDPQRTRSSSLAIKNRIKIWLRKKYKNLHELDLNSERITRIHFFLTNILNELKYFQHSNSICLLVPAQLLDFLARRIITEIGEE